MKKSENINELAKGLAELVAKSNPADVAALEASTCPKCGKVVEEALKEKIASIGEKITVRRFVRYELGEGLEKRTEDFAEEVAKQIGN